MKIKKDDLKLSGSRVLQKEFTGKNEDGYESYNWHCIASFHFLKGSIPPEEMAAIFYNQVQS